MISKHACTCWEISFLCSLWKLGACFPPSSLSDTPPQLPSASKVTDTRLNSPRFYRVYIPSINYWGILSIQAPHFWPLIIISGCWFLGDSSSQPPQTWDSQFPWTWCELSTLTWSQSLSQLGFTCPEIPACLHLFPTVIILSPIVTQIQWLTLTFTIPLDLQIQKGKLRTRLQRGSVRATVTRVGLGEGCSLLRRLCYTQI